MSLDERVGEVVPAVYELGREETGYLEKAAYYSVGKKVPTTENIRPTIFERIKSGFQDAKEFAVESITGRLAEVKQQRAEAVEDAAIRSHERQLKAQQKGYEREDRRRSVAQSGWMLKNVVRIETAAKELASKGIELTRSSLQNEEGRLSKRRVGILALGLTATVGGAWFVQKYGANPFRGMNNPEQKSNINIAGAREYLEITPKLPASTEQVLPKPPTTTIIDIMPKPRASSETVDQAIGVPLAPKSPELARVNIGEIIKELRVRNGFDLDALPSTNAGRLGVKDPVGALERTRDLFAQRTGIRFEFTPNYSMVDADGHFMNPAQLRQFNKFYAELYAKSM